MEPQPAPISTDTVSTSNNKPLYRRPLFYVFVLLILLGTLAIALLYPGQTSEEETGPEYITGLAKDKVVVQVTIALSRYPFTKNQLSSTMVGLNTFEGLTILRDGKLQPGLAESWTNPDDLTWRIKLRQNVKFHSGTVLKASDVKYTFDQAKASAAPNAWGVKTEAGRVDSVTVIDDNTVELKTKQPDATLLNWLVYVGIMSEEQVLEDGLDKAVGTGPYEITMFSDKEVTLTAFADYWGGQAKVKELVYQVDSTGDASVQTALEEGKYDIGYLKVTATSSASLASKGLQVKGNRSGNTIYLAFDTVNNTNKYVEESTNPFKDPNVRKAVLLGLDVDEIITASSIDAEKLSQFGHQDLVGYNSNLSRPDKNVVEAKKLLTDAGYPNGFTVTFDIRDTLSKQATEIKEQLSEIGITVKLNLLASAPYFTKLLAGDFAMIRANWVPDTLDSLDLLNSLFHSPTGSKGEANTAKYANTALEDLLDEASGKFSIQDRIKLTQEAHALIMEDYPSVPLYTDIVYLVSREDIALKVAPGPYILGFDISGRQKAASTNE